MHSPARQDSCSSLASSNGESPLNDCPSNARRDCAEIRRPCAGTQGVSTTLALTAGRSPEPALLHKAELPSQQCRIEGGFSKLAGQQRTQRPSFSGSSSDGSSATNPYAASMPTKLEAWKDGTGLDEVEMLRRELESVRERMAQMDVELNQSRLAHLTVEHATGSPYSCGSSLADKPSHPASIEHDQGCALGKSSTTHPVLMCHMLPNVMEGSIAPGQGNGSHGYSPRDFDQSSSGTVPFRSPTSLPNGYETTQTLYHRAKTAWDGAIPAPRHGMQLIPQVYESQASTQYQGNHCTSTEPLNYRQLLDRSVSCNWRNIVDKIVRSNDQQASIFLQQKLKIGNPEQKFDIVQSIIDQAYPLMVNRFGNFLVQRCFEHGTPEQVVCIANAIRGNTLNLSMDAFGCHVVQKAFDCVPEEYKALMVHELLRRIPETVIHRYACHVWQKLFELRWSGSPPQIMRYVNESLQGMWHEVALGETGSLVVQNIFENCLEDDKRPCIKEVLASIDVIAHGQFGNWCIQHICEHGSVKDRISAVDHVIRFAREYSMDQFASKVVEKCLKIGGPEFLDRYLRRVCESHPHRPRMALIDIAGDQFGNYLVQYILSNADAARREVVANHVRKHMVSLRGSKYGSRVAMLCCNPAVTTKPGPPAHLHRTGPYYGSDGHTSRGYVGMSRHAGFGSSCQ
ncbi:ARM repeat-containing protein [Polychaeton citri CBS 116435]|uniref:ARM repeat-containing protein n=1 Tax=Polychaeton citri CBS 116435 TaxID=1314669 RepID=A0A9P4USK6_9PEZI|nr:ARM repeat-containing protein [Polychaeton citri CBS 116435]